MGSENFNRQFILLDFADLDNPDFLSFTRSPEFSTYLVMRRHVWRSSDPHYMGLHTLYATGFLACSLERDQIAELLNLSLYRSAGETHIGDRVSWTPRCAVQLGVGDERHPGGACAVGAGPGPRARAGVSGRDAAGA
jgi:hypothetical protein